MTKIAGSGSSKRHESADPGSVSKCHGSATLKRKENDWKNGSIRQGCGSGPAFIRLDPKFILKTINLKNDALDIFCKRGALKIRPLGIDKF